VVFACTHQPLELPAPLAAELAAAYAEPHRAYHGASHIAEVLAWFDRVFADVGWQDPPAVYVAVVFHDAIYVPGAKDNEARSADWVRRSGLACDLARAAALVELTASHGHNASVDRDAALFLDCDMAILGASPAAFDAYDAAIAREYAAVPAEAFRAGRRTFLQGVLAMPRIFLSDYFHELLDGAARSNLARALARRVVSHP
jgi:predicted metal-dependent HD superfamily phosphohydrolase